MIVLFVSGIVPLFGQRRQPQCHTYTDRDGLLQNTVTSIVMDRREIMWFGTEAGLHAFDGHTFLTFQHNPSDSMTLSGNYVSAILEDRNERLWIGTDGGGLCYLDKSTGFFHSFVDTTRFFSNQDVLCMAENYDGRLWLGSSQGLRVFDPDSQVFRRIRLFPARRGPEAECHIETIVDDGEGGVWVGSLDGLFHHDKGGRVTHWARPAAPFRDHQVWAVANGPGSLLWVGTNAGLYVLDRQSGVISHAWGDGKIRGIHPAGSLLWVATLGQGLFLVDPVSGHGIPYPHDPANPLTPGSNSILASYVDYSGALWLGTQGGGVSVMSMAGQEFMTLNEKNGLRNVMTWSFIEFQDKVWVGTASGIATIDWEAAKVRYDVGPADLAKKSVLAMSVDNHNRVWVGTNGDGLMVIEGKRGVTYRHDPLDSVTISSDVIYAILPDMEEDVWIGTLNGLNRLNAKTGQIRRYSHDAMDSSTINHNIVLTMHRDRIGRLWVGTNAGLCRYVDTADRFERIRLPLDSMSFSDHDFVQCFYEDTMRQVLWIGTTHGMIRMGNRHAGRLTRKDGLPSDLVYGMVGDRDHRLWISTSRGLCRYDPSDGSTLLFDASHGLQGNDFNQGAVLSLKDGRILFGGTRGLTVFRPVDSADATCDGRVVVSRLAVEGQQIRPLVYDDTLELDVPWDSTRILFEFALLKYENPEGHRYQYLMEGFDKRWSSAEKTRTAAYAHLEPGTYRFRVRAYDGHGTLNSREAMVRLTVRSPWWATWWFAGVGTAGLVTLVMGGFFLRLRSLHRQNEHLESVVLKRTKDLRDAHETLEKRVVERTRELRELSGHLENVREEERTRIAREVHDELGQQMTVLKMDIAWLGKWCEDRRLTEKIREMTERVGVTIESIQRIASELRPAILDQVGLAEAIEWQLRQVEKKTELFCAFKCDDQLPVIHRDTVTAVFRVLQEALTNVIRHAEATRVDVHLTANDQTLELVIQDNGRGISQDCMASFKSIGLISMRERALLCGGLAEIGRAKEGGTMIRVLVPVRSHDPQGS